MKPAFFIYVATILAFYQAGCQSATSSRNINNEKMIHVGGTCEGCEAIFESPIPFEKLDWVDTLPDFNEKGPRLIVSGTVYRSDGKTPAPGIILYIYHTDQGGNYTSRGNEKNWEKRHGYIRGWVRTNEKGEYKFLTLRPASYPNSRAPQHIHPTIKEPGLTPYWIDEFVFEDDPFLAGDTSNRPPRGGSGILKIQHTNGIQIAKRDIILGLNVPGYPTSK